MRTTAWRYVRSGYGSRNADFDIVNESGGRVASTPYEDKARAIAEVPAMIEALRGFVKLCEGRERPTSITTDEARLSWDNMDSARAILQRIERK